MRRRIVGSWCLGVLVAVPALAVAAGSPLVDAAKQQDKAALRALLQQRADVNEPQADGATALHWAAHWDDAEAVDLLLAAGAKVNAKNDYAVTPLSLAVTNGNLAITQRLLKAGADVNAATSSGETPLMTAVRTGNGLVVETLIASGATVNTAGGARDQTALMWAVSRHQPAIMQTLIAHGADINARSTVRPEYVSFGRGDPQGGRLSGKADGTLTSDGTRPGVRWVQKGGFTPLLYAAQQGDLEAATLLLTAGAHVDDVTAMGESALMLAIYNDHAALATFLLEKGASPDSTTTGYSPLHMAVARKDLPLVQALLAHHADPNVRLAQGTPIIEGVSGLNQLNEYMIGATPFLLAAALNQTDIMRVLVPAGADPKIPMVDGTTATMAAFGVNPGIRSLSGFRTVVGGAAQASSSGGGGGYSRRAVKLEEAGVLETVRLTLEVGVDVNAVRVGGVVYHGANARTTIGRDDGDTALHTATADRLSSVIELLVSHGAKLDAKNNRGLTPLGIATSTGGRIGSGADDGGGKLGDEKTAATLRRLGATE